MVRLHFSTAKYAHVYNVVHVIGVGEGTEEVVVNYEHVINLVRVIYMVHVIGVGERTEE